MNDKVLTERRCQFYQTNNEKLTCLICPRACVLSDREVGFCGFRIAKQVEGQLQLMTTKYGEISALNMDPIEKKPLFHFYPGTQVLSLGVVGCNMDCPFCQNYQLSNGSDKLQTEQLSPDKVVKLIHNQIEGRTVSGVALTYSEPISWYEYLYDTAKKAMDQGLYTVMVSNGMISHNPLVELINYLDGANIDVKCFNRDAYHKLGGDLDTVKNTVATMSDSVHLELTYLVIPNFNDDEEQLTAFIDWVRKINPDIPVHFNRYFPSYQMETPPTPITTLENIYQQAKSYLNYVYLGNIKGDKYSTTWCPSCGEAVITRSLGQVSVKLNQDKCQVCKQKITGRF